MLCWCCVVDLACAADGQTLYILDNYECIRVVDVAAGYKVRTVDRTGYYDLDASPSDRDKRVAGPVFKAAHRMIINRNSEARGDSKTDGTELYVTCNHGIARFNTRTEQCKKWSDLRNPLFPDTTGVVIWLEPYGVAQPSPRSKYLVFSCYASHSLYSFCTETSRTEILAGTGGPTGYSEGNALSEASFYQPLGICIDSVHRRAFVADCGSKSLKGVTLPSHLF